MPDRKGRAAGDRVPQKRITSSLLAFVERDHLEASMFMAMPPVAVLASSPM